MLKIKHHFCIEETEIETVKKIAASHFRSMLAVLEGSLV